MIFEREQLIRFSHCDPAAIVFFPRYHRWMDAASLNFFMSCGSFLVWYFGGRQLLHGQLALGELMAFSFYLMMLYRPLKWFGDKAPAFKAVTTQGEINFPEQYAGSWVILFSHPADFTPVCTSEFMTFASMEEQFAKANCRLVGLSVDGLFSHIAWLRTIKEKIEYKGMKNVEVKFPLIEDITMTVANKYGMIQPGEATTKAVRAVFFIDPKGIIRTIIYYPLSLGRNFDELYRVVLALQTADEFSIATPADWRPGDEVIVPALANIADCSVVIQEDARPIFADRWPLPVNPKNNEKKQSTSQATRNKSKAGTHKKSSRKESNQPLKRHMQVFDRVAYYLNM